MRKSILVTALILALALLQATILSLLPTPLAIVNPALMVITALSLSFRFRLAVLSALVAGLIGDSLVSRQAGACTFAMLISVMVVSFLITRFVSHRTTVSVVGTNAVAFITLQTMTFTVEATARAFSGGPFFHPATVLAAACVMLALPVQCCVVLVVRWLTSWLGNRFRRLILVSSSLSKL
ncbi:hypothetical protein COY93_02710 [Candidatus Uhrbacteria bacterium CG_4_10_14_0_8_um_filter_58_22]|uniref:Rod shape-determining protein MreD n=1 Tax=Candidatus Uhrbacteria bacterium CG_4_10_14_0_8_um_filter_58_22 TaxID=1975029 RepID=A0A2M7Q9S6_9BACT|nr:MAG: hypothetical protein AUJ19_00145 [Parcubacteria group bacterium CG1_02_58_44]PIY62588.1 MAG: hypothetical protein COY93_02710 [Candidatus Uhrbacteria bacterium CG_4_10_14_0_8_um_filter_58_22]